MYLVFLLMVFLPTIWCGNKPFKLEVFFGRAQNKLKYIGKPTPKGKITLVSKKKAVTFFAYTNQTLDPSSRVHIGSKDPLKICTKNHKCLVWSRESQRLHFDFPYSFLEYWYNPYVFQFKGDILTNEKFEKDFFVALAIPPLKSSTIFIKNSLRTSKKYQPVFIRRCYKDE